MKGRSRERSQGLCLSTRNETGTFLALHNRKHKRKSGKDRSKGLDLRVDKNLST